MTQVQEEFKMETWLDQAFRGDIPEEVSELMEHYQKSENIFGEMLTQVSDANRPLIESLHDMHKYNREMVFQVMQNLFMRHLEHHP